MTTTLALCLTTTGNFNIITHDHMAAMSDQEMVCNSGHFDNVIDIAKLDGPYKPDH
jgi:adenosylhomocysteinase